MTKKYSFLTEMMFNGQYAQLTKGGAGALAGGVAGHYVGSGLGTGLGAWGGAKLAGKISGKTERNAIKMIILQSDTPSDCIDNLKKLGTEKALRYASKVQMMQKDPGWKEDLVKSINIKNWTGTGLGAVGGGYLGYKVGSLAGAVGGAATGYALAK